MNIKAILKSIKHSLKSNRVRINELETRLKKLEYHAFNRRFYAVEQAAAYLVGAQIEGDYLEFGVYQGNTFVRAYQMMSTLFPKMKFFAFDSFEGLPAPKGLDNQSGYSSNYHPEEFACSDKEFQKILKKEKVDLKRVEMVKGWYNETLKPSQAKKYKLKKAAFVWIDCDLYESTVPVLKFIQPYLVLGTVIAFDDWHAFRNNPKLGEQRACHEWLSKNPKIKLTPLFSYGYGGVVFTVTAC